MRCSRKLSGIPKFIFAPSIYSPAKRGRSCEAIAPSGASHHLPRSAIALRGRKIDGDCSDLICTLLIIVAGRPGMGKTAFALNIAANAAYSGVGAAVFSLEMAKEQLVLRMLCSEARVNSSKVRSGYLGERDFPQLAKAAGRLHEAEIQS